MRTLSRVQGKLIQGKFQESRSQQDSYTHVKWGLGHMIFECT